MPSRSLALALLVAAPLPLWGCGEEPGSSPGPAEGGSGQTSTTLDELAATGYAGWDEVGDGARSGVTVHDRGRTWAGINLYTDDVRTCLAVDMDGAVLHRWRVPRHDRVEHFELLAGGRIAAVSVDQGVSLLEADSTLVWQRELAAHHDLAATADGGFLVPVYVEREWRGRRVRFDAVVRLDALGAEVERWDTFEHLDELRALHERLPLDEPPASPSAAGKVYDYFHLNAIEVLSPTPLGDRDPRFRAGNLLLCFRNPSLLVVLDTDERVVRWHWGPGELDFPHAPSLTRAGRILVFDNGPHRGHSRLVEVDPADGDIAWSWKAAPPESFFSDVRGACQRLPNGNTLVTESERGRAFELAPDGQVVWEYWNPEVRGERRRRIYRVHRVPAEQLEPGLGR